MNIKSVRPSSIVKKLLIFISVLCCISRVSVAEQLPSHESRYLSKYLRLYGFELSSACVDQYTQGFLPLYTDCGTVSVCLDEILYDGQMMFTAACVKNNESTEIMVIPGGAEPGDPVGGYYFCDDESDKYTYREAAIQSGKKVVAVYAYIKEFDTVGLYCLDSFTEDENSILVSAALIPGGSEPLSVTWSIQLYEVDIDTWEYTCIDEKLVPIEVQPIEFEEKKYQLFDKVEAPFLNVKLIRTALGTYLIPDWFSNENSGNYIVTIEQADQENVSISGLSLFDAIYMLDDFPDTLSLSVMNWVEDKEKEYAFVTDK